VSSAGAVQDTVAVIYTTSDKCMYHGLNWQHPESVTSARSSSVEDGENFCLTDGGHAVQRSVHCQVGHRDT